MAPLSPADQKLLAVIQENFPLEAQPYLALANLLETTEADLFSRIQAFQRNGTIRRLGAIFDSSGMGYITTLVAASVPPDCFKTITELISHCPEVTHNYRRDHVLNLWFSVTARSQSELEACINALRQQSGLKQMFHIPTTVVFKRQLIGAVSAQKESVLQGRHPALEHASTLVGAALKFSPEQQRLGQLLQVNLPETTRPYDTIAADMAQPVERVLGQIEAWLGAGLIRRLGAVLAPWRFGYHAKALTVMMVPERELEAAGTSLAEHDNTTHVYGRETAPDWPYNLYAMIHGHDRDDVYRQAEKMAGETQATGFQVLFTTEEYKKTSMHFFD